MTPKELADFWFANYLNNDMCGLCGNGGVIDTRGIKNAAGFDCGGVFWCLCPNGQALQASYRTDRPPEALTQPSKE